MIHASQPEMLSNCEVAAIAAVLLHRYGEKADSMVRHFISEHDAVGDRVRAKLWNKVASDLAVAAAQPIRFLSRPALTSEIR